MQPALRRLVDYVKSTKVFRRNKKDVELKILAALLYFFGLSLRKTSDFLSLFKEMSHESVRIYYHRLKKVLKQPRKKSRRLIAIDETKLKLENNWTAVDVDTDECLAILKEELAYVFLKEVLKYCENKPEIVVDRGFWYLWALQRLRLKYRHETFGMLLKGSFSDLKRELRDFGTDFLSIALLLQSRAGWMVL